MSIRTVVERCKEGMMPLATQEGRKWSIPKKSVKPVLTRHQACVHFQYIESIQSGANPKVSEADFIFLADVGFITELGKNGSSIQKLLKDVKLTALVKALVEKENEERRKQGKTEIVLEVGANVGVVKAETAVKNPDLKYYMTSKNRRPYNFA